MTETRAIASTRNEGIGLEWKAGLMANVGMRSSIGAVLTIVGADDGHYYWGGTARYHRWLTDESAATIGVGVLKARPSRSFRGEDHTRIQGEVRLLANEYVGALGAIVGGMGEEWVEGGVDLGYWPGLLLGPVFVGLWLAAL